VASKNHLLAVKGNQPELKERIEWAWATYPLSPEELYALWRGHWGPHHPRDPVLGEDASRSRKDAAGLRHAKAWRGLAGHPCTERLFEI